ncbi:Bcr/CflA family drug resistance efflux transporter [Leifsonia sp. LS1]|uniref:multidrug effflux MFS transporter n=1 Tax=Leifsonia sp. LS1 TaxID=2828483 RepID=UPI001CFCCAAD|nr:multidrug effflux MFS transporter [Leifsonia sp. LS1]GIT81909.1 Bcr/CflA family drug resistance efflux transporter [Leifsonia sp. LS1]
MTGPAGPTGAAVPLAGAPVPVMSVRRSILLLGVLEAFGPLSMDLYLPQLPQLAGTLGTSAALAQATMAVCMVGLGVGQLVAGPLSDRYGRRRPLLVGVALFAVLSLACALAPTIEVLLAARLLQGLAGSAGLVITMAVARDMYSGAELSRMLSLLALVSASAPIVAPVAGGALALVLDWRGIFGVLAGVGAALLVLALTGLRETLPPALRHGGGLRRTAADFRALSRDGLFLVIVVAAAAGGAAFFGYLSMSSFVLQDGFGLSPQKFSLFFAANALANLIGAQLSRVLVRRLGPARLYLIGELATVTAAAVLLLAVFLDWGVAGVLASLACFLFASGVGGPNGTALALGGHGMRAGTAAAVLGTVTFTVGPIVGPLAALGGTTALTMALTIGIAAAVAATVALAAARPLLARA